MRSSQLPAPFWGLVISSDDKAAITAVGGDVLVRPLVHHDFIPPERFRGHELPIVALEISPDGKFLLCASRDRTISVWRMDALLAGITTFEQAGHLPADFLANRRVTPWASLRGEPDEVVAISWSSDGHRLVTATRDGWTLVRRWHPEVLGANKERLLRAEAFSMITGWGGPYEFGDEP